MGILDPLKKRVKKIANIPEIIIEGMQKQQDNIQKKDQEKWVRKKGKK